VRTYKLRHPELNPGGAAAASALAAAAAASSGLMIPSLSVSASRATFSAAISAARRISSSSFSLFSEYLSSMTARAKLRTNKDPKRMRANQ